MHRPKTAQQERHNSQKLFQPKANEAHENLKRVLVRNKKCSQQNIDGNAPFVKALKNRKRTEQVTVTGTSREKQKTPNGTTTTGLINCHKYWKDKKRTCIKQAQFHAETTSITAKVKHQVRD